VRKVRCPFLALLCLLCPVPPLAAQAVRPIVAVLPFQAVEAPAALARSATAFVEAVLVKTGRLTVVSQAERDRILKAQEAALADCADEDCAVRIGRLLSAAQVVMGEVVGLGKKFIVNAKIIDIATGEILAADTSSAVGEQGLQKACQELTLVLAEESVPGMAEAPREPAKEGAAVQPVAEPGAAAQPGAEAGAEAEKAPAAEGTAKAAVVKPRRQPREARREKRPPAELSLDQRATRAARLAGTGVITMQAASIASAVSFELQQTSEKAYDRYLTATADLDHFYATYAWAYAGHLTLGLGADGLWAGGAAAVAAAVFKYPQEVYLLSRPGKSLFAASWSLILAGNVLGLLAGNQYYTNEELYQDYLSATADFEEFRKSYEAGHAWYLTSRILSYSFWGLGAAGLVCAPLLHGDKVPILSGPRDRWLLAGGTALVAAGSVFQSMALNTRELVQDRYKEYLAAAADVDAFYKAYRGAYIQHVIYCSLAYTLWAGGGAAVLGALFANPDRGNPKQVPGAALFLVPAPDGFTILVSIDPRGMWL
jgi:TolB-like protein